MRGDGFGTGVNNSAALFSFTAQYDIWGVNDNSKKINKIRQALILVFMADSFS